MSQFTTTKNNQAVVSMQANSASVWRSVLFVNTRNGMTDAQATPISATHKTEAGARKWATKTLANA